MSSKLFSEFPEISPEEWKEKVMSDLKGADFEKKLIWNTSEGFKVLPYYVREDLDRLSSAGAAPGVFPYIRGYKEDNNWRIRQDITVNQAVEANKRALDALSQGADMIGFQMKDSVRVNAEFVKSLLSGIQIAETGLHFSGLTNPHHFYDLILNFLESEDIDPASLNGSLGADPLGVLGYQGEMQLSPGEEIPALVKAGKLSPSFRIIGVNPSVLQEGGATLSQELGFGLAMANEYMAQLASLGSGPGMSMKSMMFTFSCGPNYFMEVAKLRAARWLWSVICKEWGIPVDQIEMKIHAQTAKWNLSLYDPYVNVLRGTTEAMSASLGGADSISVQPFDAAFKEGGKNAARISRNLQLVLKEEAYFDKVADPAAGSYYIESLTDNIAEQAWTLFKEVEDQGGYLNAFKKGYIQEQISLALAQKKERAGARKDSILGVNQYPNFNEKMLDQASPASKTGSGAPFGQFRIAEDFEALRLQTEKSGRRPNVFLLKYGDPVWMTARATFAGNFFAIAGYEIIDSAGFDTIEDGIRAATDAKSDIVVLCSSDPEYAEIGPIVYENMHQSSEIVIAGCPRDSLDVLRSKGLNHYIHAKSNLLDELKNYQRILGINRK